jgi:hypothetical protein
MYPPQVQPAATWPGHYEFDPVESQSIEKLGGRARLWGIISLVVGIAVTAGLGVLLVFADAIGNEIPAIYLHAAIGVMVPVMIVHFAVAALYIGSGSALLRVARSQGNDVENLLDGLGRMGTAFKVEFIVSVVAIAVGIAVGFVVLPNL